MLRHNRQRDRLTVFETGVDVQLIGIVLRGFDHVQIEKSSELLVLAFVRIERFRIEVRIGMSSEDDEQRGLQQAESRRDESMRCNAYFAQENVVASKKFFHAPLRDR